MNWAGKRVIAVGGAGFVGSNLCRKLLETEVAEILVIDNLLSAERENIPESKRIVFWEDSVADDAVLNKIDDEYDYIFHLATYHGNQSSIHDPIADHDNNLVTTLKLFNRVKDYKNLKKVVYSGAGCAVAEKTFENAKPTSEDAPVSLEMDSPYSISKIVGEFYALYFHRQHQLPTVRARFQNVYGPGEVLGHRQSGAFGLRVGDPFEHPDWLAEAREIARRLATARDEESRRYCGRLREVWRRRLRLGRAG